MGWQQAMFAETADLGGLAIQLCYFQGLNRFVSSAWYEQADHLLADMSGVRCRTGLTQIARLFQHALAEAESGVRALIYIGDAVEEDPEQLTDLAARLAVHGTRLFMFQEGRHPLTKQVFQGLANLSRGAYSQFDQHSGARLRELLGAVAVFAAGGESAVRRLSPGKAPEVQKLIRQLSD